MYEVEYKTLHRLVLALFITQARDGRTNTQVVEKDTVPTIKPRYHTGQFLGFSGSFKPQSISKAGSDEGTRERAWESPILGVDMINREPRSNVRKP